MAKIIERQDDNYGLIRYEYVGNLDINQLRMDFDYSYFQKWSKKHHPSSFFHAVVMIPKSNKLSKEVESRGFISENFDLYVCIDDINTDWDASFWADRNKIKRKKGQSLPIAISRKKVIEWQDSFKNHFKKNQ